MEFRISFDKTFRLPSGPYSIAGCAFMLGVVFSAILAFFDGEFANHTLKQILLMLAATAIMGGLTGYFFGIMVNRDNPVGILCVFTLMMSVFLLPLAASFAATNSVQLLFVCFQFPVWAFWALVGYLLT